MIPVTEMQSFEQVFSWNPPEGGSTVHIASSRLVDWAKTAGLEVFATPVESEYAAMFIRDRGIEDHRLMKFARDGAIFDPITYCNMPDGSQLLVDGHHRYVFTNMLHLKWIKAFIVPYDEWQQFVVSGLPDDTDDTLRNAFSGIL